jgi:hypothetical protein
MTIKFDITGAEELHNNMKKVGEALDRVSQIIDDAEEFELLDILP